MVLKYYVNFDFNKCNNNYSDLVSWKFIGINFKLTEISRNLSSSSANQMKKIALRILGLPSKSFHQIVSQEQEKLLDWILKI